jgi:mRNA deadenylase 3'-5' endonuclease subunit Ccr4
MQVACWNVLADCYAGPGNYWADRSQKMKSILEQLRNHDMIFLQEVDHFDDFYKPVLNELGFGVSYVQRPTKLDGCVVAYARDKYAVVDEEDISFDDLALNYRESHSARNSLLRHNVAVMVLLQSLQTDEPTKYIVACSTHLYWNPVTTAFQTCTFFIIFTS